MNKIWILAAILAVFLMSPTFAGTLDITSLPSTMAVGIYGAGVSADLNGGAVPTPEPVVPLLLGFGFVGLGTWAKKRSAKTRQA